MKISCLVMILSAFFCLKAFADVKVGEAEIRGTVTQIISFENVVGKRTNTFIEEGVNYVTEANLRLTYDSLGFIQKALESWKLDAEITVRKTDNSQIDRRIDPHVLYLNARLYNPSIEFKAGDFYSNLTNITLSRNLEGFQGFFNINKTKTKITTILSRAFEGKEEVQYTRYVFAGRIEQNLLKKQWRMYDRYLVNDLTVGGNVVYNIDDGGSVKRDSGLTRLKNLVFSYDVKARLMNAFESRLEIARSKRDERNGVVVARNLWGTAIKLKNNLKLKSRWGRTTINFDYERVDPDFFTDSGSISVDREAYYARLNHRFSRRVRMNASYRNFRNDLEDKNIPSLRTINPVFKLTVLPFSKKNKAMKDLTIRTKYAFRERQSGNHSTHIHTNIYYGQISHRIKNFTVSGGYNIRRISDRVGSSDRSTRRYLLGVRYHFKSDNFTLQPSVDYSYRVQRDLSPRPKEKDVTNVINFGISMEAYKKFRMSARIGYNDVDREDGIQDTTLKTSNISAEYDLTDQCMIQGVFRRRNNDFERSSQNYDENVVEIKLVWKF